MTYKYEKKNGKVELIIPENRCETCGRYGSTCRPNSTTYNHNRINGCLNWTQEYEIAPEDFVMFGMVLVFIVLPCAFLLMILLMMYLFPETIIILCEGLP